MIDHKMKNRVGYVLSNHAPSRLYIESDLQFVVSIFLVYKFDYNFDLPPIAFLLICVWFSVVWSSSDR
jgi:hypothetical protein